MRVRTMLVLSLALLPAPLMAQGATEARTLTSFNRDIANWPLKDVPFQWWHYSTVVVMNGATMFSREYETCRARDAAHACNFDRPGSGCKAFDLGGTATTQKIRMECPEMVAEMEATWAEDGRSWKAEFVPKGGQIPPGAVMRIEARYVRPCDANDAAAPAQKPGAGFR